jgi:hypothetical protein
VPRSPLVASTGLPAEGPVRLHVRLAPLTEEALAALRGRGAAIEIIDVAGGRVQALADVGRVAALAELPVVVAIRPAERGRTSAGSVTSEGDAAARADELRSEGYDGAGTVVGVISDGVSHLASAQASGDLGGVTIPPDARCRPGTGDEGTALLEIVHDLAPGAALLFSEGVTSSLVFIDAVNCLRAAGAAVIVDDLVFLDEPFFADGPVAQTVRAAVQAGVSHHSSAGNFAQQHVEQPYRKSPTTDFHDFRGGPVDNLDDMVIPPGERSPACCSGTIRSAARRTTMTSRSSTPRRSPSSR